jgi:hypothetical protein
VSIAAKTVWSRPEEGGLGPFSLGALEKGDCVVVVAVNEPLITFDHATVVGVHLAASYLGIFKVTAVEPDWTVDITFGQEPVAVSVLVFGNTPREFWSHGTAWNDPLNIQGQSYGSFNLSGDAGVLLGEGVSLDALGVLFLSGDSGDVHYDTMGLSNDSGYTGPTKQEIYVTAFLDGQESPGYGMDNPTVGGAVTVAVRKDAFKKRGLLAVEPSEADQISSPVGAAVIPIGVRIAEPPVGLMTEGGDALADETGDTLLW